VKSGLISDNSQFLIPQCVCFSGNEVIKMTKPHINVETNRENMVIIPSLKPKLIGVNPKLTMIQ
jgi:hypothetical protein